MLNVQHHVIYIGDDELQFALWLILNFPKDSR